MYCHYCNITLSEYKAFEFYKSGYSDFLHACTACARLHKFTFLNTPTGYNVVNSTIPTYWSGEEKHYAHSEVPVGIGANLSDYDKAQLLYWHIHFAPKLHRQGGKCYGKKEWARMIERLDAAGFIDEHGITKSGEAYAKEHRDEIDLSLLD